MSQPACIDCTYEDLGFPCRRGGLLDPDLLASAWIEGIASAGSGSEEEQHWSYGCLADIVESRPDLGLDVVLLACAKMTTAEEAAILAAGPLEDLIAEHGAAVIDRIETEARKSVRFRYLLTGVWPQGQRDSDAWRRVENARREGPHIDHDQFPGTNSR